jgi:hypothetical protein
MACVKIAPILGKFSDFWANRQLFFAVQSIYLIFGNILKRNLYTGSVSYHDAIVNLHIQLNNLCDAQVSQALGGRVNGTNCCSFPRLGACSYQLNDLIDTVWHLDLLFVLYQLFGCRAWRELDGTPGSFNFLLYQVQFGVLGRWTTLAGGGQKDRSECCSFLHLVAIAMLWPAQPLNYSKQLISCEDMTLCFIGFDST